MTLHRAARYTLALTLAVPAMAGGQGFALNEIGTCAIARGFANTAAPCDDASSIYWNPGLLPRARGIQAYGGVTSIKINGEFTQDTSRANYKADVPTALVPHAFLNWRGAGKLAMGVGLYVPYGLTSQWGADFPGRFSARKASLQTVYLQPNIAYQLTSDWSIGGGPVFGHSSVELIQALDLSQVPTGKGPTFGQLGVPLHTDFGQATLKGSTSAYGFALGFHGRLTPTWEMGGRYLSAISFEYNDANAVFEQHPTGIILAAGNPYGVPAGTPIDAILLPQFSAGGPLTAQKVSTQIRHPSQLQVGFGYTGFDMSTVSAEYSFVGFHSFGSLPVNFQGTPPAPSKVIQEDYGNTSAIRIGVERRFVSGAAVRGGLAAVAAAAPAETVTPLLPEMDRSYGSVGFGLPMGRNFGLDAAYMHIFTPGRRGRLDERAPGGTAAAAIAQNNGSYALSANILSISLKASF